MDEKVLSIVYGIAEGILLLLVIEYIGAFNMAFSLYKKSRLLTFFLYNSDLWLGFFIVTGIAATYVLEFGQRVQPFLYGMLIGLVVRIAYQKLKIPPGQ